MRALIVLLLSLSACDLEPCTGPVLEILELQCASGVPGACERMQACPPHTPGTTTTGILGLLDRAGVPPKAHIVDRLWLALERLGELHAAGLDREDIRGSVVLADLAAGFVEALMGLPDGWTDVPAEPRSPGSAPSATPSSPPRRRSPSGS